MTYIKLLVIDTDKENQVVGSLEHNNPYYIVDFSTHKFGGYAHPFKFANANDAANKLTEILNKNKSYKSVSV